ncbi:MAG: helix-turn-helix domain-containing protein [Bradymonadales bacterium]|nr:MAG: helix-turn-helix domain-containing protein [Bradymonadales bacterium]
MEKVLEKADLRQNTIERWFSVEEIADHLGISKETVYRWLERGIIPANRMGKLWKFKPSEVDQWVKNGGATSDATDDKQGSVWQG